MPGLKLEQVTAVFEGSPWVAEQAWARGPFADCEQLHAAMCAVVRNAPRADQLALIRAHPELGAARLESLSADSAREQAAAGLDALATERAAVLRELNAGYRARFGFPLVICVREHTADSIIASGRERLAHEREHEIETALQEICKIAPARLADLEAAA